MVQFFVHVLQFVHRLLSAISCSAGHPAELRILRPMIMNGDIQQIVWQAALLPATIAMPAMRLATMKKIMTDGIS